MQLVWFRIAITVPVMFFYIKFTKQDMSVSRSDLLKLMGTGIVILVHWLSFYAAIKVSNVSVTMVAFSTGTLFSAIIEPVMYKRRIRPYEIAIGLIIISAIAMIFSIEFHYWLGMVYGILAAFTSSLFGVFNGLFSRRLRPAVISFYELSSAIVGLTILLIVTGELNARFFVLDSQSVVGILLLSLVCTVFPFIASVDLSKYISPYTIVLTVNLETVYGIIWAILFYNENKELKPSFYLGVVIILAAIVLNWWLRVLSDRRSARLA
jgi:drug/metabolite transporter (DMT)-like permease